MKAEIEIEGLHLKLDQFRQEQWQELVKIHTKQLVAMECQSALKHELIREVQDLRQI